MKINIIAFCFFIMSSVSFAQGFLPVANVSRISGKVYLDKELVKAGQEITESMQISIPKKGDFIEVKFQNGHVLRMVGVEAKVATLNPKNTLIDLNKGKIYSKLKPLTQNETYTIKTKHMSINAKGTHFLVHEEKKQTYLCVTEGMVEARVGKQSLDVRSDEDVIMGATRQFKVTLAAKSVLKLTREIFELIAP